MQKGFYVIASQKKLYDSLAALQQDLDAWMVYYNNERPNSGRYCYGKTAMQTFKESLTLTKQKMLSDLFPAA